MRTHKHSINMSALKHFKLLPLYSLPIPANQLFETGGVSRIVLIQNCHSSQELLMTIVL